MRVLLLTRYGDLGGSSRLRHLQLIPHLARRGITVTVLPLVTNSYIEGLYAQRLNRFVHLPAAYLGRALSLWRSKRYDVLWIQQELFPWLPAYGETLLNRRRIPYVVDYDDAIFHRYDLHKSRLLRAAFKNKIDRVMRAAAVVTVGNEYLGGRARSAGAHTIEYLPTCVDLARYESSRRQPKALFTIGWIGAPPSSQYLYHIAPALKEVCRRIPARCLFIGSGHLNLSDVPSEIRPWSEDREVDDLSACDVGIMPLKDGPWERGKCGYKLIQYMASRLPVVASPVGMNRAIVKEGVNGFLAQGLEEWVRSLTALYDDNVMRERLGKAGRDLVEEHYSLAGLIPRVETILHSASRHYS